MPSSDNIASMQSAIVSAADVSGCVVTRSLVGSREVLVAHISTPPDVPVPALKLMFDDNEAPEHVACWGTIPMSATGDPDAKALEAERIPGCSCVGYGLDTSYKRDIARIWAGILHASSLGSGDSFLELGGHSLLAIRMLARVNDSFGVRIPIYEFLNDPTITGIANQIVRALLATEKAGKDASN
jgi:acyl carrier protein